MRLAMVGGPDDPLWMPAQQLGDEGQEGTVAVNYYYAAKKRGGVAKRKPGRPKAVVVSRNDAGSSKIETVLKSLADLLRAQQAELESLRRDNERFAELRKLIAA